MERTKYPRTPHFAFSDGPARDDDVLTSARHFSGRDVVATIKLDGECTTIYCDGYTHARSRDGKYNPSQAWIKAFAAQIAWQLPRGVRIIGEYMYASHSIKYTDLATYFYLFAVVDHTSTDPIFWGWDDTEDMAKLLDIPTPTVLYRGPWDEEEIRGLVSGLDLTRDEGYVVRTAGDFPQSAFKDNIGKYVKANLIKTERHWSQSWEKNQINETN